MKVKLDENIPVRLAGELAMLGHDVDTVASEGLQGRPDNDVWSAARRDDRFLITQDLDFSDVRQFKPGNHAGLLLVRLREPGANALVSRIRVDMADRLGDLVEPGLHLSADQVAIDRAHAFVGNVQILRADCRIAMNA